MLGAGQVAETSALEEGWIDRCAGKSRKPLRPKEGGPNSVHGGRVLQRPRRVACEERARNPARGVTWRRAPDSRAMRVRSLLLAEAEKRVGAHSGSAG
ncbi:hypothetical protein Ntsu_20230 [Nocardia sp. IFM 10818]